MAFEAGRSMIAKKLSSALIVDDCSVIREITKKLLSTFGYDVWTVTDGVEAVQMYKAGEGNFDLIITDLEMPVMNGIQATKELRRMGVDCMIIGASACNDESLRESFMDAGLDHLFHKPLTIAKLQSCLREG
ncbi:Response regulatory domain-containing protein [Heracleum sosnowskyi]|uniref:Response regulatory domain-containing protein n=1 Tax=Heracleum sosnowskyi TaxID=360622 RepID=A0AAD8MU16_9APIA|nr:Response regulatory domain-containing protein [Heracleum sosnowskyi]